MQDGFVDGKGQRYNPSMIRVGVGQSSAVSAVSLETKLDAIFAEHTDVGKLDLSIIGFKSELSRITQDIARLRRKCAAILSACPYPLSKAWEIRVDEQSVDEAPRVYFVNHREKTTTYECPPPPEPGEAHFEAKSMPGASIFGFRAVPLPRGLCRSDGRHNAVIGRRCCASARISPFFFFFFVWKRVSRVHGEAFEARRKLLPREE
jgi:senataxin